VSSLNQRTDMYGSDGAYPKYDINSCAERLNVSRSTLQRLMNSGKIKFLRIGGRVKFSEPQVQQFLAEAERQSVPAQRRPRRRPARCGQ
jgi:excisionase family DNA binding protein